MKIIKLMMAILLLTGFGFSDVVLAQQITAQQQTADEKLAAARNNQADVGKTVHKRKSKVTAVSTVPYKEGNKIDQGTVTPDVPRCSAFEEYKNEPDTIKLVSRPGGREGCPPGYRCENYHDVLFNCVSEGYGTIASNHPACAWDYC